MHGRVKREKITRDRISNSARKRNHDALIETVQQEQIIRSLRAPKPITIQPLTNAQRLLDGAIFSSTLTFAVGPAGVGKTWLTAARMAEAFVDGKAERLIVMRPAVEAEEELGFLPGGLEEKIAPWAKPVYEVFAEIMGANRLAYEVKAGKIEFSPLAYLRGNTFKRALVLLDEAQNTTPGQMKLVLTRIGEDARIVVDGDLTQKDIAGPSGLEDAMRRLRFVRGVSVVEFGVEDIVRSGFCRAVVRAYDEPVSFLKSPIGSIRSMELRPEDRLAA